VPEPLLNQALWTQRTAVIGCSWSRSAASASAVCIDPEHRGRSLATRLVLAVAACVRDRGETLPHAAATNVNSILLGGSLGFRLRRTTTFRAVRVPEYGTAATAAVGPLELLGGRIGAIVPG
jgi:GNAT superfamily N-acetyltransferase